MGRLSVLSPRRLDHKLEDFDTMTDADIDRSAAAIAAVLTQS